VKLQAFLYLTYPRHFPQERGQKRKKRDGEALLKDLMARVGSDAWQRASHAETSGLSRHDPGPVDPESLGILRGLLRAVEGCRE